MVALYLLLLCHQDMAGHWPHRWITIFQITSYSASISTSTTRRTASSHRSIITFTQATKDGSHAVHIELYTHDQLCQVTLTIQNVISRDKLADCSENWHGSPICTSNQASISSTDTEASNQFLNLIYLFFIYCKTVIFSGYLFWRIFSHHLFF